MSERRGGCCPTTDSFALSPDSRVGYSVKRIGCKIGCQDKDRQYKKAALHSRVVSRQHDIVDERPHAV
jgi:hypothetical protein